MIETQHTTEHSPQASAEYVAPDRVLDRKKVELITTFSTSKLYREMEKGSFPRPILLGTKRRVGWLESEILAWLRTQPRSQGRVSA